MRTSTLGCVIATPTELPGLCTISAPSPTLQKTLPSHPQGRALKNYRYFHFIGVVRRHYRAFTRRSGYDVW